MINFEDITSVKELYKYLDNISYGWLGIDEKIHIDSLKGFKEYYRIMNIDDVIKYKVGLCGDVVNLCKYYFDKNNINNKVFVIVGYENVNNEYKERVHFMILYNENGMWYQLEHASRFFKGIFVYNTLDEAKKEILNKYKNILKDSFIFEIESIPVGMDYKSMKDFLLKNMK